jgi:hypothetical protein
VQELLQCSFLHTILELQSETRHPQSPLTLSYPEAVDHPDQPRDGSDKPLRLGPKIDRPPTDHRANAADHHGGARPKKRVIGGIKAAIGRQMIGKDAQISGKTTPSNG